jgi:hypothetical protein
MITKFEATAGLSVAFIVNAVLTALFWAANSHEFGQPEIFDSVIIAAYCALPVFILSAKIGCSRLIFYLTTTCVILSAVAIGFMIPAILMAIFHEGRLVPKLSVKDAPPELFEEAENEYLEGEKFSGLRAKALALNDSNESKAKAFFIRTRVDELLRVNEDIIRNHVNAHRVYIDKLALIGCAWIPAMYFYLHLMPTPVSEVFEHFVDLFLGNFIDANSETGWTILYMGRFIGGIAFPLLPVIIGTICLTSFKKSSWPTQDGPV